MKQQNATSLLECADQKAWLIEFEEKPELVCIYGPYINQRIIREICGDLSGDQVVTNMPTTHHDQHWHHAGKTMAPYSLSIRNGLDSEGEVKSDCSFVIRDGLKIRKEREGCLISDNNNAYFANNVGSRLLQLFGDHIQLSDVKFFCKKIGISEVAGKEFFRNLVMFGLYIPV